MSLDSSVAKVGVINIGFGNVGSCFNMLDSIERCEPIIVDHYRDLKKTDMLILPGVGSYDTGMNLLNKRGFKEPLIDYSKEKSILGICLGMQLICQGSLEGNEEGLGIIKGYFRKFPNKDLEDKSLNVPCMGWNFVEYDPNKGFNPQLYALNNITRYYFVHSYYYCGDDENICGWSTYGIRYGAVIQNRRTLGVQFHPEKSHEYGRIFLRNWISNNS